MKWLKRLVLTEGPSDNWYHIYDNRVLPTMVDPEESSKNSKWWTDERYAIYDLSTNSATAYPAHEEQLCLSNSPKTYQARGYAYGGGGRRISRVELSLDQGKTWRLADIDYPEDRYRDVEQTLYGGKLDMWWRESSFCWCFWSLNVPVSDLVNSKDLLVRAMDEAMNIQPRDMYWSVLGMMNNPWYRVVIHKEIDHLRFEHPTQPALLPGGWMERVKKAGGDLTNGFWGEQVEGKTGLEQSREVTKEVPMKKEGLNRLITIDELRKHDGDQSPWFVLKGEVYDGTSFLDGHPGGGQSIISAAGMDATDEFVAIHSETAKSMMPEYHIGTLDAEARRALVSDNGPIEDLTPRATFLQSKAWTSATLHAKRAVSWDTRIFTFKLQHDEQSLGLPTGQHLMIKLRDPTTHEAIIRPYTPISEQSEKGYMDVLVKVYFDTAAVKGGKMSQAMDQTPIGHSVDFKGPIGKFEYLGRGSYMLNGRKKAVRRFLMICAGSGVTPIYQVFRAVMRDSGDKTECIVISGNRLEEDILCKEELDALKTLGEGRGNVIYTLSKGGSGWLGLRGRVDGVLVKKHCSREPETVALICGPEALEKSIHQALKADGWDDDQMVFF